MATCVDFQKKIVDSRWSLEVADVRHSGADDHFFTLKTPMIIIYVRVTAFVTNIFSDKVVEDDRWLE